MNDWKIFNETALSAKQGFYINLSMENISDSGYVHRKNFKIKNLGEYYDLYAQSNTLFLADVFENLQNMCFEIYEFDSTRFFTAPRLE